MTLLASLVGYWPLNEASGNALDAHGANALAQAGSVGTAAGKVGTARDFPGTAGNAFSHASNSDLQTGDVDFTVACWFNADAYANYPPLAMKESVSAGNVEWMLYVDHSLTKAAWTVGGATTVTWGTTSPAGSWYHVVAWHDSMANQIGISVNGGTAVLVSYSSGAAAGTFPFRVGSWPNYSRFWDGRIDEVGFWKRVLTAGERAELYNGGAGFAYPFTVVLPDTTVPGLSFPGVVGSFPCLVFPGGW